MLDKKNRSDPNRLTEMTLAEQLKITERDIERRKELAGFSRIDADTLKECLPYIQPIVEDIVDEFYEYQRSIHEIQLLIGDAETFRRLHSSMKRYVIELFEGFYDSAYVNRRLRIGKVHKSIGVSPKLYISSLSRLENIIVRYLYQISKDKEELVYQRTSALRKLIMLDIQFVFDTYINSLVSEVVSAKKEVEIYATTLEKTVAKRTKQLEEISRTDDLTGLRNQRAFYELLRHEMAVAERNKSTLALIYFDLNNFKKLNDLKGHRTGDDLLCYVGKTLLKTARTSDICCRYGGDEFCVIMSNADTEATYSFCERLQKKFDSGKNHNITISFGIAYSGPDRFLTMDELVNKADQNMYQAKAQSKKSNTHAIYPKP